MAMVIVLLVLILTLAFFYLKCKMMQSVIALWSAVIATIVALSYYEFVAGLFLSRGYGLQWAHLGSYLVLYLVVFAILRSACEFLIGVNVDLGNGVKVTASLVCGFLTGIIFSGNILIVMGLLPLQGKVFYSRFDASQPVSLNRPQKPALATDGFVVGLYRLISSGSLSSSQSFGVLHADYLSQIHLNKLKVSDKVLSVCSPDSVEIPSRKDQHPVRLWTSPDNRELVVVRMGINAARIDKGGAANDTGRIEFFPAQIRLIVRDKKDDSPNQKKKPLTGSAKALYPVGFLKDDSLVKSELNQVISPDPKELEDKILWLDAAFEVSSDIKPVLLEFKQNAAVDLSSYEVVKSSPEIENALNSDAPPEG